VTKCCPGHTEQGPGRTDGHTEQGPGCTEHGALGAQKRALRAQNGSPERAERGPESTEQNPGNREQGSVWQTSVFISICNVFSAFGCPRDKSPSPFQTSSLSFQGLGRLRETFRYLCRTHTPYGPMSPMGPMGPGAQWAGGGRQTGGPVACGAVAPSGNPVSGIRLEF